MKTILFSSQGLRKFFVGFAPASNFLLLIFISFLSATLPRELCATLL